MKRFLLSMVAMCCLTMSSFAAVGDKINFINNTGLDYTFYAVEYNSSWTQLWGDSWTYTFVSNGANIHGIPVLEYTVQSEDCAYICVKYYNSDTEAEVWFSSYIAEANNAYCYVPSGQTYLQAGGTYAEFYFVNNTTFDGAEQINIVLSESTNYTGLGGTDWQGLAMTKIGTIGDDDYDVWKYSGIISGACNYVQVIDTSDTENNKWGLATSDDATKNILYNWGEAGNWHAMSEVFDSITIAYSTDADGAMTYNDQMWWDEDLAQYKIYIENVELADDTWYKYRVLVNGSWDAAYPHTNSSAWHESQELSAGTYNLYFTYDPVADELELTATAASGSGEEEEEDELNPSHPLDPGSYLVTVQVGNSDAGSVSGAGYYAQGATATLTATPNAGYEFVQWSDGVATNPRSLTVRFDTTITAQWQKLSYTIRFVDEDGTTALCDPLTVEYGEVPVYSGATPTKAATVQYTYSFSGWTPAIAAVTGAQTYVATYSSTVNEYQITFNANGHGTAPVAQTVAYGSKVTQPTAPTAEGYAFGGWYTEAACTNPWDFANTTVTGAQTLFAKWTIQSFSLAWDVNGGSELSGDYTHGTVVYGTTIVAPSDPTRAGYTFTGWSPSVAATMPASDVTYTATWTEAGDTPYKVEHYQQNLADNDYTLIDTDNLTGKTGSSITPASKGYTGFDAPSYDPATIAADGSTVVKLYYDRLTYTITWVNGDGNTIETDANVKYGATPSYNGATPTKTATSQYTYTFTGWNPVIAAVTGAQTYIATFDAVPVTEQSIEVSDEKQASELPIGEETEISVASTGHLIIDEPTTCTSLTLHYADAAHAQVTGIDDLTAQQVSVVWHLPTPDGGVAGHWFSFAVPFDVNVTGGIFVSGSNTAAVSGKDFVIEEYDGNQRATTQTGWTRVAKNATLHAGHLYMLYVASAATWRFVAADPSAIAEAETVSVAANASSIGAHHAGWNGIANTLLTNAEGAYDELLLATVYNNTYSVYTATTLDEKVFTAASPFFVQVAAAGSFEFSNTDASPVARRAPQASSVLSSLTITNAARTFTDKAYLEVTDNATEQYTIGHDLQKMMADAPAVPQLWLSAYGLQLAAHLTALDNNERTVAVGLYAPAEADYTIALSNVPDDLEVYLTKDGLPVWNITNSDFTLPLTAGNNDGYGLHIKRVKDISTGVNDIESQAAVQKVVINDKIYILRDGKTYSVTGAKVESLSK